MCGIIVITALLIILGLLMFSAGFEILALTALVIAGVIIAIFPAMKKGMGKMAITLCVVCGIILVIGAIFLANSLYHKNKQDVVDTTPVLSQTDWETVFRENEFSDDEISEYKEIFDTIGISDYHDVDIHENGIMHIVRGKVYDSNELQLNVTLENRKIIYVALAGIPDTKTEAYINWRGQLKFKTVGTTTSVDLYSDTDGGYLAKVDWENKTISAIE